MLEELMVMKDAAGKVLAGERKREPKFGNLVILLRDAKNAAGIRNMLLEEEDTEDAQEKEEEKLDERNRIRRGLRRAFRSITVHVMPSPHHEINGEGVSCRCVCVVHTRGCVGNYMSNCNHDLTARLHLLNETVPPRGRRSPV